MLEKFNKIWQLIRLYNNADAFHCWHGLADLTSPQPELPRQARVGQAERVTTFSVL
jgi:hypothetical protein